MAHSIMVQADKSVTWREIGVIPLSQGCVGGIDSHFSLGQCRIMRTG